MRSAVHNPQRDDLKSATAASPENRGSVLVFWGFCQSVPVVSADSHRFNGFMGPCYCVVRVIIHNLSLLPQYGRL